MSPVPPPHEGDRMVSEALDLNQTHDRQQMPHVEAGSGRIETGVADARSPTEVLRGPVRNVLQQAPPRELAQGVHGRAACGHQRLDPRGADRAGSARTSTRTTPGPIIPSASAVARDTSMMRSSGSSNGPRSLTRTTTLR